MACGVSQAKLNVAVLEIEGDSNITSAQRSTLSDRLQEELIKLDTFVVLDRSKIAEILSEQGFQHSGACDDSECQVEMGKLLGVEKMINAKVVNFGPAWTISATMTDVESGAIDKSENATVEGQLFDVLERGCPVLARKLTGLPIPEEMRLAAIQSNTIQKEFPIIPNNSYQLGKSKWYVAGGLLIAGVGSTLFGVLKNNTIQEKQDAYSVMRFGVETPEQILAAEKEAKEAESNLGLQRNLAYGLGAVLLASGVTVSIWF